jgi:pSer/pThr/pTyr-binding forkhead associated (FHA) protein
MSSESQLSNILIVEDSKGRREIMLDGSVYSIGRDPKCDIRLSSQFVSRHHATLVQLPRDDNTFYYRIVDGNLKGKPSANGMLINGRKLQAHDLKNEDEIVFGPQALVPCGVSLPTISLSRGDGEQGRWGAKNGSLIRAKLN